MRSPARLLSRISIRLMLFNLLLVFLPVAGMLFIDIYEQHLEQAQIEGIPIVSVDAAFDPYGVRRLW